MKRLISLSLVFLMVLVCMAVPTLAEEPTSHVTESSGNGYALYNGVKLPNIDTVWTDKETYPYAFISSVEFDEIGTVYTLNLWSVNPPNGQTITSPIHYVRYSFVYGVVDDWTLDDSGSHNSGTVNKSGCFWASHDILNIDGTTYLSATSPIPLDGMTVIEWDGVTDGLDAYHYFLDFYKVSDDVISADNLIGSVFGFAGVRAGESIHIGYIFSAEDAMTGLPGGGYGMMNMSIGVAVGILPTAYDDSSPGVYLPHLADNIVGTFVFAYTPSGSEPENPTDPTDPVPDLDSPAVTWGFTDRELIISEFHPIVAISDIGADGQCVLYSRSLYSDATTSEWTPYMTDEVMKGDSGIDMCAFDLYPDQSKVPYSMQYKAVVTLGSGTNTAMSETDVLTIHWVKSSTVDPTEPTIDGGGSSGDVDSDDDVPMLQAIWQAITDGFNNVGVWLSAQFNSINTWGQDIVDAINNGFGSMNDLESNVDEFQESVNHQGSQLEDMAEAMGAVTRPDVSTAIPDISGYLTVTGPVTLAAVFDPFWKNSYILRLLLASLAVSVAFTVVYGGKK